MHGACCDPQNTCERLAAALPQGVELQCASGNFECVGGGFDWRGDGEDKAAHIEQLLPTRTAESSSNGDNLLVGFSRGAFVARDVALARPGRYSALVLIGASITLDVPALKAAGIRRVVLAAGEYDSSFKAMKRARDKLALNGIEARFVPLGKVFHELPADAGPRLREAVAWASELPRA
jgi:predicted esterase